MNEAGTNKMKKRRERPMVEPAACDSSDGAVAMYPMAKIMLKKYPAKCTEIQAAYMVIQAAYIVIQAAYIVIQAAYIVIQ